MKRIAQIEKNFIRDDVPEFKSGDTVKVHVKIKEGDKERIQVFQGTVISRRGGGTGETFTVRKTSYGVGIERIFPLHSPNVDKIERIRQGKVRRAKLYYLRDLTGKSARIEEKLDDKATGKKAAKKETKAAKEPAKAQKTEKPEKADKAAKAGKAEKAEKTEKADKKE